MFLYIICLIIVDFVDFSTSKTKYLLVGLPKSGTSSFQTLFTKLNMKSVHWQDRNNPPVGVLIRKAKEEGRLLLHYLQDYDAITQLDMFQGNPCYFPQFDDMKLIMKQYPDITYILNSRNVNDHANSMAKWRMNLELLLHSFCGNYLRGYQKLSSMRAKTVQFITDHNQYIRDVFSNSSCKFMEFNLDNPNMTQLESLVDMKGLKFPHENKTPVKW
jgi:hypothetical protein